MPQGTGSLIEEMEKVLAEDGNILFAYIFGSASRSETLTDGSDVDVAVYFSRKPDSGEIYSVIQRLERIVGEDRLDLLVLNGCEDFFLKKEILTGQRIFCRDKDGHAAFFSWTLRMYEDESMRMRRYWG